MKTRIIPIICCYL